MSRAMSAFGDVRPGGVGGSRRSDGPAGAGDQIGSYRLVRALGAATGSRVFEVVHVTTGDRAAMKLLGARSAAAIGGTERLLAEAQALRELHDRHIVAVTDFIEGEGPAGIDAVVMELVQGRSLAQLMAQQGPLPIEQFLPILVQVLDALKAAHGALLVHRNLTPASVLLVNDEGDTDELVRLLRFGLAGALGEPGVASRGGEDANDAYRSPEQAAGAAIDHRTDIYSFGVILYELLCGRLPFEPSSGGAVQRDPGREPARTPSAVDNPVG